MAVAAASAFAVSTLRPTAWKVTPSIFRLVAAEMVSQKGANALMCAGGAASEEVTRELGRWFRARSSPG